MENNFSKNLKFLREYRKLSQQEIANKVGVDRSTIGYWETGKADPTMLNVCKLADALNIDLITLIGSDLKFDNSEIIDIDTDIIKIPVYGTIKAGIPIESQNDIIDYVEIPKDWTKGGKRFFALKVSRDSMFPTYIDEDIVIFEQNNDKELYNNKDCAVMINGTESTFKKVLINDQGIVLQPYNLGAYDMMMFSKEQVESLPIRVVGIAVEKRTKL